MTCSLSTQNNYSYKILSFKIDNRDLHIKENDRHFCYNCAAYAILLNQPGFASVYEVLKGLRENREVYHRASIGLSDR